VNVSFDVAVANSCFVHSGVVTLGVAYKQKRQAVYSSRCPTCKPTMLPKCNKFARSLKTFDHVIVRSLVLCNARSAR
jgi:hypothetical protein